MNYWAWGGQYIGHRSGDILYYRNGTPLGKFYDNELYDFSGKYIGEIKSNNRLIVNNSHKYKRKNSLCKPCSTCGTSYCGYAGYAMHAGCEDFKVDDK